MNYIYNLSIHSSSIYLRSMKSQKLSQSNYSRSTIANSNMREVPVSQVGQYDGFEDIKTSNSHYSARGVTGKGLRYYDIIMIVSWSQEEKPEIRVDLKREHVEAIQDSRNPILFLFAMALASRAFKDYDTVDEIFYLEAPQYNRLILEWATHMLHVPIPRGLTSWGPTFPVPTNAGLSRTVQESSLHSRQLENVFERSSYDKITPFDFRSGVLTSTCAYSNAQRMKFANHNASDTYQVYYMAKESFDGFLSPEFQRDHQIGSKTATRESPEEQTPTGISEESYPASPQIGNPVVTQGKPTSLEMEELGEVPDIRSLSLVGRKIVRAMA